MLRATLIGMTFYGTGWGHGVGMCQVGAYGMAMDGASYDEILKTYYTGIELRKCIDQPEGRNRGTGHSMDNGQLTLTSRNAIFLE